MQPFLNYKHGDHDPESVGFEMPCPVIYFMGSLHTTF